LKTKTDKESLKRIVQGLDTLQKSTLAKDGPFNVHKEYLTADENIQKIKFFSNHGFNE
jgi:hypothetical protein